MRSTKSPNLEHDTSVLILSYLVVKCIFIGFVCVLYQLSSQVIFIGFVCVLYQLSSQAIFNGFVCVLYQLSSQAIFIFFLFIFLTTIIFYSNACYNQLHKPKLLMKQFIYIYNINIEKFVTQ